MFQISDISYYLFVGLAVWVYASFKKPDRSKVLFVINFAFLSVLFYFSKKNFVFLWSFICLSYLFIKALEKKEKKGPLMILQGLSCLSFLFLFKYSFFQNIILNLFPNLKSITGPLSLMGVSFFVFRVLSLSFDIFYGGQKDKVSFFTYCNFVAFFPTFLSGPLDRYQRFCEDSRQRANDLDYYEGSTRIIQGLFKKLIIGDLLYSFSLDSFNSISLPNLSSLQIIMSSYLYMAVLYFDFSGYSDVAIGIGRLFGIKTPENFNRPFSAKNIQDFWNRWHITFFHWLRDYIYIPLQRGLIHLGFKSFTFIAFIAYMFTFFIAGVWHKDTSYFAIYGLYHGAGLSFLVLFQRALKGALRKESMKAYKKSKGVQWAARVITLHFFLIGLIIFIDKSEVFGILARRLF